MRYVKDMELGLPAEAIEPLVQNFLEENDFYSGEWLGSVYWMRDDPKMKKCYFFDYSYDGNTLHMEAWLHMGGMDEMGLTGFFALAVKTLYLQKIHRLTEQLIGLLPADSPLKVPAQSGYAAEGKLLQKNKALAYAVFIFWTCFTILYVAFVMLIGRKVIADYLIGFLMIAVLIAVLIRLQNFKK